jgi:chorismate lyase / 3-hydroxybenzoate synthase
VRFPAVLNAARLARFAVHYQGGANNSIEAPGTLALLGFGQAALPDDPRALRVPLSASGVTPYEHWRVDARVTCGSEGSLQWAIGGGWLFAALDVQESQHGGIEAASEFAYRTLCGLAAAREERHLLRIWNYLHAINEGEGDSERYRQFCIGRARGLNAHGVRKYPAATAIGHRGTPGLLQVYALCARRPGEAMENPRQVSAWRYPRQYGPTPPSFARALKLPTGGLAISGTAAVVGHASQHGSDVAAQVRETCINLRALLETAGARDFDADSPLKVYVRNPEDAPAVETILAECLDASVPRILLLGDICRRELLVEIDGWSGT